MLAKLGFVYPGLNQLLPSRIDTIPAGRRASGYPLAQIEMVVRVTEGDPAKIAPMAAEVLAAKPSVFVSTGPSVLHAALAITKTLPIVATNFEEYRESSGYAQSIAHSGRNVTGVFLDFPNFAGKWIELLLIINARTAEALGIAMSAVLQARGRDPRLSGGAASL